MEEIENYDSSYNLSSFDTLEAIDFGDMALKCVWKQGAHNDVYLADPHFVSNGHYADGTNFSGGRFNIPEGITSTYKLFANDNVLKEGVNIPASVDNATMMYAGSNIEILPEFPKDSRLFDMTRMCSDCRKLSDVPSLPEDVKRYSDAFTNTFWDDNRPIFDKSDEANIMSDTALDLESSLENPSPDDSCSLC